MGQVPDKKASLSSFALSQQHSPHFQSHYLLIGSGRLARHLDFYLKDLGLTYSVWNRSQPVGVLQTILPTITHVLLAISDRSIVSFFESHLTTTQARTIHFSGSLNDDRMTSAHPLMSFGHTLFDSSVYRRIHFTLCGASSLNEVLPGFPNPFSQITAEQKSLYHALCVFAGNFSTLLWKTSGTELKSLGLPPEALQNYVQQTLNNFSTDPENSLTGPFVRRDYKTIESNLKAVPSEMAEVYIAFIKLYSKDLHQQLVTEKGSQL